MGTSLFLRIGLLSKEGGDMKVGDSTTAVKVLSFIANVYLQAVDTGGIFI